MKLVNKYSVLICVIISVILIVTATLLYPGGCLEDKNSIGFDWTKNFISNLFAAKAINGLENASRIWAITGMVFHSFSYGLFFIHSSKKMATKHATFMLKWIGIFSFLFTFLIVTPLHDMMVIFSATLFLIGIFYITVFLLKTKLHLQKIGCIFCLLIFYYTLFVSGTGDLGLLAIMQKVSFISSMLLILGLEYFTKREDFSQKETIKPHL